MYLPSRSAIVVFTPVSCLMGTYSALSVDELRGLLRFGVVRSGDIVESLDLAPNKGISSSVIDDSFLLGVLKTDIISLLSSSSGFKLLVNGF